MPPPKESCVRILRAGCYIGGRNIEAYRAFVRGLDAPCIRAVSEISLNLLRNRSVTLPPSVRRAISAHRKTVLALVRHSATTESRRRRLVRAGVPFLRTTLDAYTKVFLRHQATSKKKSSKKNNKQKQKT